MKFLRTLIICSKSHYTYDSVVYWTICSRDFPGNQPIETHIRKGPNTRVSTQPTLSTHILEYSLILLTNRWPS